jgi:DNA-binding SARP family transcriptional activator
MLEVSLFGKLYIRCAGKTADAFGVRKVQELLCYLLINRRVPHHREVLATLLWEDASASQSKQYLRKTLWQLQAALDKLTPDAELLIVDNEWIQFNAAAEFWLDLADFEQSYARSQSTAGSELDPQLADALHRSVGLYHGDLLQGWYQEWCLVERERFQIMYLSMLDKLMDYCVAQGAYGRGVQYGMQILRVDLARERTYRQLMYLHALAGDRAGALRCYERCVAVLAAELGVEPTGSTVALYDQLCKDELPAPAPGLALVHPLPADLAARLRQVSASLSALQATLEDLHGEVHRQLTAINHLLDADAGRPS